MVADRIKELEELLASRRIRHVKKGRFFFIPAVGEVQGATEPQPILRLEARPDLPPELNQPEYRTHVVYFHGLDNFQGIVQLAEGVDPTCDVLSLHNTPITDAGLLAMQEVDLEGKTVLNAGAELGEYAVLAAKMGAYVYVVGRDFARAQENADLNDVGDRVRFEGGDLSDMDPSKLGEVSVIVNSGWNFSARDLLIAVESEREKIGDVKAYVGPYDYHLIQVGFSVREVEYSVMGRKAAAVIATRR